MFERLDTGTKVSAIGHIGLIGWVMLGGFFSTPENPMTPQVADVSIISGEEYDAMVAAAPAPAPRTPRSPPRAAA